MKNRFELFDDEEKRFLHFALSQAGQEYEGYAANSFQAGNNLSAKENQRAAKKCLEIRKEIYAPPPQEKEEVL